MLYWIKCVLNTVLTLAEARLTIILYENTFCKIKYLVIWCIYSKHSQFQVQSKMENKFWKQGRLLGKRVQSITISYTLFIHLSFIYLSLSLASFCRYRRSGFLVVDSVHIHLSRNMFFCVWSVLRSCNTTVPSVCWKRPIYIPKKTSFLLFDQKGLMWCHAQPGKYIATSVYATYMLHYFLQYYQIKYNYVNRRNYFLMKCIRHNIFKPNNHVLTIPLS